MKIIIRPHSLLQKREIERNNMKYCSQSSDFPAVPHTAVLHLDSVYVPGDERSIQCPGHGYPAHYKSIVTYIAFNNTPEGMEELRKWVENNQKEDYRIIEALPKSVKTKLTVELS